MHLLSIVTRLLARAALCHGHEVPVAVFSGGERYLIVSVVQFASVISDRDTHKSRTQAIGIASPHQPHCYWL